MGRRCTRCAGAGAVSVTRLLRRLVLLCLLVAVAAAGWIAWTAYEPLPLPRNPLAFTIAHGSGVPRVARQIAEAGLPIRPLEFRLLVRLSGKAREIKAGNYLLDRDLNMLELIAKITRGDVTQSEITFIEGQTVAAFRRTLAANRDLKQDTAGLSEAELLQLVGAEESVAEGLFFPDTYLFSSGMSDLAVLRRAYQNMKRQLASAWEDRAAGLPFANPYEALVLASIVEKETAKPEERAKIAGVFINRLRQGVRLQTDPTVIYGLGERFDGNLRKRDLAEDTPYNTYLRPGLPPTPIAAPGLAAIQATLRPEPTDAQYFVARGDGSHHFSRTLEEHNRAVARYQRNSP